MPERDDLTGRVVTFRIPEDLLDGLEQLWQRDGMSKSEAIRRALRAFLESKGIGSKGKTAGSRKRRK
jgi:metal-responsive CopG/Arc/MetJ family transcriptional regulator